MQIDLSDDSEYAERMTDTEIVELLEAKDAEIAELKAHVWQLSQAYIKAVGPVKPA